MHHNNTTTHEIGPEQRSENNADVTREELYSLVWAEPMVSEDTQEVDKANRAAQ